MNRTRSVLAGLLALLTVAPAVAQQFPTIPGQSVIGRLGLPGDRGPSQAIPLSALPPLILAGPQTWASRQTFQGGVRVSTQSLTPGIAGSFVDFTMAATSGNTNGQLQAFTAGGASPGNIVLQPLGGNVGVGPGATAPGALLTVGPAAGFNQGLLVTPNVPLGQTLATSNYYANWINAVFQGSLTGAFPTFYAALQVNCEFGGASANELFCGSFGANLTLAPNLNASNDIVGSSAGVFASQASAGILEGFVAASNCASGCTTPQLAGIEIDSIVSGTGAPVNRFGMIVASQGTARATSATDAAFGVNTSANVSAVPFLKIFALNQVPGFAQPISTSGDFFYTDSNITFANLFNCSTATGGNNCNVNTILSFPNVILTGSGTLALGNSTSNGGFSIDGIPSSNNPLTWKISGTSQWTAGVDGGASNGFYIFNAQLGTKALIVSQSNNTVQFFPTATVNTSTDAHQLINGTAASSGNQSFSPATDYIGQGWKTTATAASQQVQWRTYAKPIQGTAAPSVNFNFDAQINSGGFATEAFLTSGGVFSVLSGYQIGGAAASGHYLRGNGTSYVDGAILAADLSVAPGSTTIAGASAPCAIVNTTSTTMGCISLTNSYLAAGTFSNITGVGTLTAGSIPTTLLTGALQAAQEPAHTGDVTNSAGSLALALATAQPAVHTWALAQTFTVAPVFTDQSGSRTALGLGNVDNTSDATKNAAAVALTNKTSFNKVALTAPATSATLTLADGTTLTQTTSTSVGRGQYQATNTNDNATAGNIGEVIELNIPAGSAVSLTTATPADITGSSFQLTAGDWDVWGNVAYTAGGSTVIFIESAWISATSATLPTAPNGGAFQQWTGGATGFGPSLSAGMRRISISAPTTVYLSTQATFNTSTLAGYGYIGARRVR